MSDNMVITIGRQYGTGGREIGEKLAQKLGIPFYDRELIAKAAKKSGFDETLFDQLDKRATNSFLYSLTMFGTSGVNGMSLTDQLFLAQSNTIHELAEQGSCVIVGRCADHVLREHKNRYDFYIHAPLAARIKRIKETGNYELSGKSAESALEKMDKQRATYYNYYTGLSWGKADHYDLCINAGRLGIDGSVELIESFIKMVPSK